MSNEQVHNNFKVFLGELAPDHSLGGLAQEVTDWASKNNIAAKSIGVEYLESSKKLVLTVGYKAGEAGYPIELKTVDLGQFTIDADGVAKLEQKLLVSSKEIGNVICHELYVTEEHDFIMVFLVKK